MNTVFLIDKPAGWTSFDVVAKLRGRLRAAYKEQGIVPTKRQLKIGHAGTLDPFATGLLVVLVAEGTRQADEFLKLDKVYEATVCLGKTSTTGDPEGEIIDVSAVIPSRAQVETVLKGFVGTITQTPPIYSAIKINGQRAYNLARKGKEVEIPTRQVVIHSLELIDYEYPHLRIRTHVGSGTYIRSLAADIGEVLKTGAYCSALRRTAIAQWTIDEAQNVDTITGPSLIEASV